MTREHLSQAEIDTLLRSGQAEQDGSAPAGAAKPAAPPGAEQAAETPPAQPFQFGHLKEGQGKAEYRNIDLILDVSVQVTVELGRTHRRIRDVLALGPGAVVELEKLAGEPVDVLVNGQPVARGEVVVIGENFGVRISDIISRAERVSNLQ